VYWKVWQSTIFLIRFARLINIDFFEDLLQVLKKISIEHQKLYLSGDEGDSPIAALHCIIAAFELLESVGGALKIDISDFYSSLYVQMSRLSITIESYDNIAQSTRKKTEMQLLLRGIEFMLKKNREVFLD
jgi:nucleolar complex protein 3